METILKSTAAMLCAKTAVTSCERYFSSSWLLLARFCCRGATVGRGYRGRHCNDRKFRPEGQLRQITNQRLREQKTSLESVRRCLTVGTLNIGTFRASGHPRVPGFRRHDLPTPASRDASPWLSSSEFQIGTRLPSSGKNSSSSYTKVESTFFYPQNDLRSSHQQLMAEAP